MSDTLSRLLDKQRIVDTLAMFCRGVDRLDPTLIRSVFHVGAVVDYGPIFHGDVDGFIDFITETYSSIEFQAHHIGTTTVRVSDNVAGSECYVIARVRTTTKDGIAYDTTSYGRYIDWWSRSDGYWQIEHRRYVHGVDDTRMAEGMMLSTQEVRDQHDPSYEALATGI